MSSPRGKSAAVFLLGLILGAAAGSWGQRAMFHRMMTRGPDRKRMLERISRDLGLDEKQKAAVSAIMDSKHDEIEGLKKETFLRLEAVRESADAEIAKVLTPAQVARFEEIRRARHMRVNWEAPEGFPPPPPLAPGR